MNAIASNPKVSVLIPAYNAEKFIAKAINSILKQSYRNLEILILDDGSTDHTRKILHSFSDPRILAMQNQTNAGYLKSCNRLFSAATGDLITFQDADDLSVENRIEKLVLEFQRDAALGASGTYVTLIDKEDQKIGARTYPLAHSELLHAMHRGYFLFCGATVMVRKEILERIGSYREYFDRFGWEDYDWMFRIAEKYKTANLPEELYLYRQHPTERKQTPDRRYFYGNKIVKYLGKQRSANGADALERNHPEELDALVRKLDRPFVNRNTGFRIVESHELINRQKYGNGLAVAATAIREEPLYWKSWSNLLYCLYIVFRRKVTL